MWRRHVGESAEIVVIKNAGHAVNIEKPKEFIKHLKSFLFDSVSSPPSPTPTHSALPLHCYWS